MIDTGCTFVIGYFVAVHFDVSVATGHIFIEDNYFIIINMINIHSELTAQLSAMPVGPLFIDRAAAVSIVNWTLIGRIRNVNDHNPLDKFT